MAKNRTLNEIRQSKEYQQAVEYVRPSVSREYLDFQFSPDVVVDKIVESLNTHLFDIIFQAVNDEMHKYTVFQEQTYLTAEGMDMFEEQWFEFYHEHHGEILGRIMKSLTN
jgi:hypothetical protein